MDDEALKPAVRDRLESGISRTEVERAKIGATVSCEVHTPTPGTLAMTLETPAAVAHANTLLADKRSGWRLVSGCHECGWGKVLGCWRCGSR
jgi:hypothetical protein